MTIRIASLGHLSALGQGVPALIHALDGDHRPTPTRQSVVTATGTRDVDVLLSPEPKLPSEIPESIQRRMPRISRMCLATAIEAVDGGPGRSTVMANPERVGVIVASAFACLDVANHFERRIAVDGPAGASPSLFASSVHNAVASHLSITFGVRGPACTVTTTDQSAMGALQIAADWMKRDIVDHVIVSIADEITEFHSYAVAHRPDCTAVLGEGAITLLLSKTLPGVELSLTPAPAARCFFAVFGHERPDWAPTSAVTHAGLYGGLLVGLGFEIAVAALRVRVDGRPTVCLDRSSGVISGISINSI